MKTKICTRCKQEKKIWKSMGKDEKYCSTCWNIIKPRVDKPRERKPMVGKYFRSSKQKSIRKVSDKLINLHEVYKILREKFLKDHRVCQAALPGCLLTKKLEVHHKMGREGQLLLDTSKWLCCCRQCHSWITKHSLESIELGLSLPRITGNNSLNESL